MVASNDREAVREATDHLIQQGHSLIGLIEGPDGFRSARERRLGFEDALNAAGHHAAAQPDRAAAITRSRPESPPPTACSTCQPAADRDLRQQRRDGGRRRLRGARARHRRARRAVGDRLRRHPDRRPYLAAAHHGALADRLDGARGGAQAGRRHGRRPAAASSPPMLPSTLVNRASVAPPPALMLAAMR